MSGWWSSASASSPTRFTNASASTKVSSSKVRSSASSTSVQPSGVTAAVSTIARDDRLDRGHSSHVLGGREAGRARAYPRARLQAALERCSFPCFAASASRRLPSCSRTRRRASAPRSSSPAVSWWPRPLLLQLKTLLDNADGQLARVTGRVTLVGRYLDTDRRPRRQRGGIRGPRLRHRRAVPRIRGASSR